MSRGPNNTALDKEDITKRVRFFLGRRPKRLPQAVWLNIRPWRITARACYVFCILCFFVGMSQNCHLIDWTFIHPNAGAVASHWMFLIFPAFPFVGTPLPAMRRYLIRVEEHNHEICLTCGYHLTGLPTEHRCPECGTEYNLEETRETWRKISEANGVPTKPEQKENTP